MVRVTAQTPSVRPVVWKCLRCRQSLLTAATWAPVCWSGHLPCRMVRVWGGH